MLPRGYGIRNTVSLLNMRQCLDDLLAIRIGGVKIPVFTFLLVGLLCLFIVWFRRTKLGQDMRAVGQDMEVAKAAGINVDRTRIISVVMSSVCAGFGMVIYLQNIGNLPTYTGHAQIGMFCIAALLVGGASVEKAAIGNAFLGVILFHLMFIVAPGAGAFITGDSMVGEYFRVFLSYGVITLALIMYEAKKRMVKSKAGQMLANAQKEEEAASQDTIQGPFLLLRHGAPFLPYLSTIWQSGSTFLQTRTTSCITSSMRPSSVSMVSFWLMKLTVAERTPSIRRMPSSIFAAQLAQSRSISL